MSVLDADFVARAGAFSVSAHLVARPGITVLFGPSGSGKSLCFETIAGIRRPSSGSVVLNGAVVGDASRGIHVDTQDRHVGVVFQDSLLLPHRSVAENVALAVRLPTRRQRHEQALQALATVGALGLQHASPRRLSGGERQRVALARAVAGAPQLLMLDEPFSALDHATRLELRTVLRRLVNDSAIATLLITHDIDEAAELADWTIAFRNGATEAPIDGFRYR